MNGKKTTSKAKLKSADQEERLLQWKEHFKNLFRNPTNKPIQKIINDQIDIKLEQFMEEEIDTVSKKN